MNVSNGTTVDKNMYELLNGGQAPEEKNNVDNDHGEMDQQDFLNLLVTELQNQDPLEPMKNSELTSQTSQFSQLEQLVNMNESISKLSDTMTGAQGVNNLFSASSFIGKTVDYEGNNIVFDGEVGAMQFELPDQASFKTEISIMDKAGRVVNTFQAGSYDQGKNTFYWDGSDAEGNMVEPGVYKFRVNAVDVDGNELETQTYANGVVDSATLDGGKIVFSVYGEKVGSDKIISVRGS